MPTFDRKHQGKISKSADGFQHPMIRFIYKNMVLRLVSGAITGIIAWLIIGVIFSLRYRYFNFAAELVNLLYAVGFGIIILELIVRANKIVEKKYPWEKNPIRRCLYQSIIDILIAIMVFSVLRIPMIHFFFPGKLIILGDELIRHFIFISMVVIFCLLELGIFLNDRYRTSLADLERFRKENAEYQFEMLKLQLNPHFLFNSLNTLSSLVYEDAGKATDFIRKLSEVYRYVLDNRNKELVNLSEELDFISAFTYLLAIRFQGMINFNISIEEKHMERKIAPMTVQMLVENAVKHNVVSAQRPLNISISVENDSLAVINNLQPRENNDNTGVGLKNISSRYGFLTKKNVEIIKDETSFRVNIPLI